MWIDYLALEHCRQCQTPVTPLADQPLTVCTECWMQMTASPKMEKLKGFSIDEMLVVSAAPYQTLVRQLIHDLKYRQDRLITSDLARLTEPAWWQLSQHLIDTPWLVPVPLYWTRRLARGFNQSELIGQRLCQNLGLHLAPTLLHRSRRTKAHHGLSRIERFLNVEKAFTVKLPHNVPKSIVLIDDVFTSGATLLQCATVLRQAGINQISALSVARA